MKSLQNHLSSHKMYSSDMFVSIPTHFEIRFPVNIGIWWESRGIEKARGTVGPSSGGDEEAKEHGTVSKDSYRIRDAKSEILR